MVIEQAREVLRIEARSILDLVDRIGPPFQEAVDLILKSKGRVILTGMGKSGLVARKISATFNSTGTPSLFLHPADAAHGDLGMVTGNDIVLALSKSGQTAEVLAILPSFQGIGAKLIAFTGSPESALAKASDVVIHVGVEREACPMGMAPTASTTAALAMGDALAVALIHCRRFNQEDFKRFHPGGSLGERLRTVVREVMITGERVPSVSVDSRVLEAVAEMDSKRVGATLVLDVHRRLAGILTDGDLRRAILKRGNIGDLKVHEIMSPRPKTIDENCTAADALGVMERNGITHLVIVDADTRVKGLLHLHDILGREQFRINGLPNSSSLSHR